MRTAQSPPRTKPPAPSPQEVVKLGRGGFFVVVIAVIVAVTQGWVSAPSFAQIPTKQTVIQVLQGGQGKMVEVFEQHLTQVNLLPPKGVDKPPPSPTCKPLNPLSSSLAATVPTNLIEGYQQVIPLAKAAGFAGDCLVMALAVARAESSLSNDACFDNTIFQSIGRKACQDRPGDSEDRGVEQINNRAHPSVSDACAYNVACNLRAAYQISGGGKSWGAWSTYHNGRYITYVGQARLALQTLGGEG